MGDFGKMFLSSIIYHCILTVPVVMLMSAVAPAEPGLGVVMLDVVVIFFYWCWASHATAVHNMQDYSFFAALREFPKRIIQGILSLGEKSEIEDDDEDRGPRNRRERRAQRNAAA